MKILTVPDLHGKDYWKSIDLSDFDKIIFLGDYVDSRLMVPPLVELKNLTEIIGLKSKFHDKIELLLGNHDIQYMFFPKYQCSVNYQIVDELVEIFTANRSLFKVAFQIENHLWTHAGVSKSWFKYYCEQFDWYSETDFSDLHINLNNMIKEQMHLLTTVSELRGGTSYYGGVFWADMEETKNDNITGLNQYIGHTKVPDITVFPDNQSSHHFLDCLDNKINFHLLKI